MIDIMRFGFGTSPCYVCSEEGRLRMHPRNHMITDYADGMLTLRRHYFCEKSEQKIEQYRGMYKRSAIPAQPPV